jgi:DNA helicase-2/ATP-dependent DNA helicase PcrA
MIDYRAELNDEQYRVVTQGDGPCLVLAGAGSGKTRTVTYRVAYLLEQGVGRDEILLVTFTNKAAKEMTHRIKTLLGDDRGLTWAGTFHHIAFRLLRAYAPLIGYERNFSILDQADSVDLLKMCLKQEGISRTEKRFPSAKVIKSIISYARNAEMMISDVLDQKHEQWIEYAEVIGRVADTYAKKKREANVMDFDDLLTNLHVLLLKESGVRERYATQFRYVLVDEYQDTNNIQSSLIRLLSSHHKNLLVVGDDAQSIYSFRAANIQNILDFDQQYRGAKTFRLETNYRSTPEILTVANDVISNNADQLEKTLKSNKPAYAKPEVHACTDGREEAEYIAERMLELRDEGVELQEMAVLFRAAFHSQALEVELTKRGIPYDYRGGVRFFERSHIKDVLAFLKIKNNPSDAIAWSRVLNMQTGIGAVTASKIYEHIQDNLTKGQEMFAGVHGSLGARARMGWNDFGSIWDQLASEGDSPNVLIRTILETKYQDYLQAEHPDYRERMQDIEQFAVFAERYTELTTFIAEVIMQESFTQAQAKAAELQDEERVVLSTIHQAKGLEWDAVFVINLANGQFPNERASRTRKGLEEERRLFYVAVTRAKQYLHLSYPMVGSFRSVLSGPSRFIEELRRDLLEHYTSGSVDAGNDTFFLDPSDDVDDISYEAVDDGWGRGR